MNILLIDKRVSLYEDIVAAIDPVLAIGVTFDYDVDTFETIKTRISEALQLHAASSGGSIPGAASVSVSVGLIQHNYNAPTFSMVSASSAPSASSTPSAPSCIVAQVATLDPTLESWAQFKEFVVWCKTVCGAAHFDLMACALYSNPDWKYIVDTLAAPEPAQTGVDIRASTDETGSAALGGNWFLESHTGVNLKDVYFTELIETYRGVLGSSSYHSLFIKSTGAVYAAGYNPFSQLGLNDLTNRNVPTLITSVIGSLTIVAASTGHGHSLFLTSTGAVYATGHNIYGALGLGDTTDRYVPTLITSGIGGLTIVSVSAGFYHSLFLTSAGAVYATGQNGSGNLGLGDLTNRNVPTLITTGIGGSTIVGISAGYEHSLFLTSTGAVYAAGHNAFGALGFGDNDNRYVPTLITSGIGSLIIVGVSAGYENSFFITSAGAVYGTGNNTYGQLGLGDTTQRLVPILITSVIEGLTIVAVSAGIIHSLFLTSVGVAYAAGFNGYGQLGSGDTSNRNIPTLVSGSGTYSRLMDANNAPAKFVSVGQPGHNSIYNSIAYSYDGVTWVPVSNSTSIFSDRGQCVAYSAELSRWVAVGSGTGSNSIAYSSDGINWIGLGMSIFEQGTGIAYSAQLSRWVAVGTGTNTIAYSADGITWTGSGTSIFSNTGIRVAYSATQSRWVAGGNGTTNTIAYSTDGISWTGIGKTIFSYYMYDVAYSAELSRWVAVGHGETNTIAYSRNGITWIGIGKSIFSTAGLGVAYSASLSRWVAVGYETNTIAYSTDGISWTGLGVSIFNTYGRGVAYSAALSRWVAGGYGTNGIAYSTDGITWTGIGTSTFTNAYSVAALTPIPAKFVSVGQGTNTIAYSYNGVNWIPVANNTSIFSQGYSIAYNSELSRWVAVGEGTNSFAYSSDGISWTGTNLVVFSNGGSGIISRSTT